MPVQSGMELVCRLAVAYVGRTPIVFDLRRVVDVVADHCMMEDRDHCCGTIVSFAPKSCMLRRIVIENMVL